MDLENALGIEFWIPGDKGLQFALFGDSDEKRVSLCELVDSFDFVWRLCQTTTKNGTDYDFLARGMLAKIVISYAWYCIAAYLEWLIVVCICKQYIIH